MGNFIIKNKLKEFICIFEIIESLCPETDVVFSPDGIHIKAIHPSNHCLIIFNIDKGMFEEYNVDKEEVYTLNINLLNKILQTTDKDELELTIVDGKLRIVGTNKSFALKYFVSEPSIRKRPDVVTTSKWSVNAKNFFNSVSDLVEFGSNCKVYGNVDLTFHIESDLVEGNIKLDAEKIESDDCYSSYDLTYLNMIKKSEELFEKLRIRFGKDSPLIIRGTNGYIDFEFILAARVE